MKRLLQTVLVAITLLLPLWVEAQVVLPIEVLGEAGATASVTLQVSNPVGVDSMYLIGHSLGYHNSDLLVNGTLQRDQKASYRVNGGAWAYISNSNSNVRFPERNYLGIGGAYHTVRLSVPVSGIVSGNNVIEFRFNGTEGFTMGYRILEVDLRAGTQSRTTTTFVQDDPEQWTAPVGGDPIAGRVHWTRRNYIGDNPLNPTRILIASCSDCHASNGRDLQYYNFSNLSIVKRSQFHQLTEQEGRDIAAYIRSVDLQRQDGRRTSPYARPYNPPYQPGPGLTARGEDDWAAGAGLEWVLDSDDQTPRWLFANGSIPNDLPSNEDMRRALHIGSWSENGDGAFGNRIDYQNTPVAVMYPDWMGWLPDVHPLDMNTNFVGSDMEQAYYDLSGRYDTPSELESHIQIDRQTAVCAYGCGRWGIGDGWGNFGREFVTFPELQAGYNIPYSTEPARHHIGRLSFGQWQVVKMWEWFNTYRMQNLVARRFGNLTTPSPFVHAGSPLRFPGNNVNENGQPQTVPFAWPEGTPAIFDLAPHKSGDPNFPNESAYGSPQTHGAQSRLLTFYFSTIWYDVQMVVGMDGSGFMANNGGAPIDWNYQTALAMDLQRTSNVSQWWRMFRARALAVQSRNNYYAQATTMYNYAFNGGPGFTATNANYWEVLWMFPQPNGSGGSNNLVGNVALSRQALENYWNEWADFARTVPLESWQRSAEPSGTYEPSTVQPTPYTGANYFDPYTDADNAYRLPALMVAWGMDENVIDNFARWGESMWPLGNFEQWFTDGTPPPANLPPTVEVTSPTNNEVVNRDHFLSANATDQDGQIEFVTFVGGKQGDPESELCVDFEAPYGCAITVPTSGRYTVRAIAIDDDSASTTSKVVKYRVSGRERSVALTGLVYSFDEPSTGSVYDILGRRVLSFEQANSITLTNLPSGIYVVETETDTRQVTIIR